MTSNNKLINIFFVFFEYVMVALLILNGPTVYYQSYNKNYHLKMAIVLLSVIVAIFSAFFLYFYKKDCKNLAILLIIYLCYILIFFSFNSLETNRGIFIAKFLIFVPCMMIYSWTLVTFNRLLVFFKEFINLMVVLSILSILFWFIGSTLHLIQPNDLAIIDWGRIQSVPSYHNIYFEIQEIPIIGGVRNTGIFCEAPMYSFFLSLAFVLQTVFLKQLLNFKTIILGLTILTTVSATGLIIVVSSLIFYFQNNKGNTTYKYIYDLFISVTSFVIGIIYVINIFHNRLNTISFMTRIDDINAGIKTWMTSPLFGTGYDNLTPILKYMSIFRSDNLGFSSGIFGVLSQGGIYLLLFYVVPIISLCIYSFFNKYYEFAFFSILFLILLVFSVVQYVNFTLEIISLFYIVLIYPKSKLDEMLSHLYT